MKKLKYHLESKKIQYLINSDEKLGYLINYIGSNELMIEEDGFRCLVKYIIGQQISDKARETIWQKLCAKCDNLSPQLIFDIDDVELRQLGLSNRKVAYIKNLAKAIIDKEIEFEKFLDFTNEEIVKKLTSVKGIGKWTAEMFLIFSLGREDVLSLGDGTIKRAIKWMYNLKDLPSFEQLIKYFDKWKKYETIVSVYLWKSIELGLMKKTFSEIEKKFINKDNLYWMNYSIDLSNRLDCLDIRVGAVLVSSENKMICSSYDEENPNKSWIEILISKLNKIKIKNVDSLYLTINTLSLNGDFDINLLLSRINIKNIYLGLPDPNLNSYLLNDPIINFENLYRYPDDLQRKVLNQNYKHYFNSKQNIKYCLYYSTKRISNLVISKLKDKDFFLSKSEVVGNKDITKLSRLLANKYNLDYEEAKLIISDIVSQSFNEKYASYSYSNDIRSFTNWKENFMQVYNKVCELPINSKKILNIGVGSGNEAISLFSDCNDITFVDVAKDGLKNIKKQNKNAKIINCRAENLSCLMDNTYDIYISLRTYNSSFFDIKSSIKEAHRVLRKDGIIIISIANGFLCSDNKTTISGLIIPGCDFVDIYRGNDMARNLKNEFIKEKFSDVQIYPNRDEIYLVGVID